MALRAHNLGDLPTKPLIWADAQYAATIVYDAATGRVSSVANKGTGGGQFAPPSAAQAPIYAATGFSDAYPALSFNSAEPNYLLTDVSGPAQPATAVYVWQQGATYKDYEVFVDHDNNVSGNRQTIFTQYNRFVATHVIRRIGSAETRVNIGGGALSPGRVNILVVEYNGTSSRTFYNGVVSGAINLGDVLSANGIAIGGKKNDVPTYFGGKMGAVAVIPAIFTGDDWDRLTQGLMWTWGQQANIATGATYKNDRPMVEDGQQPPLSANLAASLGTTTSASVAALSIGARAAAVLAPVSAGLSGSLATAGKLGATLAPIAAAGVASAQGTLSAALQLGGVLASAAGGLGLSGGFAQHLGQLGAMAIGELSRDPERPGLILSPSRTATVPAEVRMAVMPNEFRTITVPLEKTPC